MVDTWYPEYTAATFHNYFSVEKTQAKVKLYFDDALKTYYSSAWALTVEYDIKLTYVTGTSPSTSISEVTISNQQLTIDYHPTTSYKDINLKIYDAQKYIKVSVENIQIVSSTIPGVIKDDIHFDVELNTRRYYNLGTTEAATIGYNTSYLSTTNELELYWSYVEGAESYDVEWLFIDVPEAPMGSVNVAYDFRNATRINCLSNNYKISMAYPRGVFLFRVRPVGKKVLVSGEVKRIEGKWSLQTIDSDFGDVDANEKFAWSGLMTDMNWQYVASFAEEGKRGEMLGIYDGSLKPRQNVAINNSDNTAVVSQPIYDYLGRPSLTLLPSPETNEGLGFYENRTEIGVGDYYDYTNFDLNGNILTPEAMSTLDANSYYDNGGAMGTHADYVADAGDYPYMRTAFLNDGTGRVKWQTAAGSTLIGPSGITAAKIVRYYYGTPTQEELYRLFGNEVGNASHYKKNCVIDQNGQAHIQYLDMSGRVIGTALAGNAPDNLLQIDSYPTSFDVMTSDLTVNNYMTVDGSLVLNKTVVFPYTTTLYFDYSLSDIGLTDPCFSGTFNPEYDLKIYIENEDHNIVQCVYPIVGLADYYIQTGITSWTPISWNVTLPAGSYTINKILTLNDDNVNTLFTNYQTNQTCGGYEPTAGTPCNPSCEDLCFSGYGFIDEFGDKIYQADNGDFVAKVTNGVPVVTTYYGSYTSTHLTAIQALITECENTCADGVQIPEVDECQIKYEQMLADMSPGGQYFDDVPFASGATADNDWLVTNIASTPPGYLTGSPASWNYMRSNWNPAWADALVANEHPEYCMYQINCNRITGTYNGQTVTFPDCGSNSFSGLTEEAYTQLMYSITYDIGIASPEEYLFNPTDITTSTATAAYPSTNRADYQPYVDGLPDTEMDPYIGCRIQLEADLEYRLKHFLDAYGNGTEYHSIWYVLNDPQGIHNGSSGYPAEVEDFYQQLHGTGGTTTGLIGSGSGQVTKYQFFRGVYLFLRDYVGYTALNDFTGISVPSGCSVGYLDSPLNNGMTADGFIIHYPENPVFENYESGSLDTWLATEEDDQCANLCQQNAVNWMADLGTCGTAGNLAILEDYLIAICEAGCDGDNPQGTDDISPATVSGPWGTFSSFAAVINYHNTTYSASCPQITHPGPTTDEIDGTCECNSVTEFVTNFYNNNSVSIPSTFNLSANLTTAQQVDLVSDLAELSIGTENFTLANIQTWLTDCASSTPLTGLASVFVCGALPTEFDLTNFEDDCGQAYDDLQSYYDLEAYNDQVTDGWNTFLANYTNTAYQNLPDREVFTMSYELKEYHYTLFYYDQAGNLIKTVPPSGIYRKANGSEVLHTSTLNATQIQDCFDHVSSPGTEPYIHPAHKMITNYKYNSLQQLTDHTTPDGGATHFWYDELGRLLVSQNAQQALGPEPKYSYTRYDVLGRVQEVGEITDVVTPMTDAIAQNPTYYYQTWLINDGTGAYPTRTEVVRTQYGTYAGTTTTETELGNVDPHSIRNRIGSVFYQENYTPSSSTYDYAIHYSYDVNGNVKTVLDDNPNMPVSGHRYKRMDYEYDLASGNVNQVNYQASEDDEFYYKYEYDANNRLTVAYTSVNGEIWEKESKNFYYAHGPLARLEIGDKIVQAQDYVYTLNGWLKTVNSSVNNSEWDAGRDGKTGTQHEYIGRDAYGFSLHYYEGDYTPNTSTGTGDLLMDVGNSTTYATLFNDSKDLYNGNISKMIVSLSNTSEGAVKVHANAYRYDQLQRIKSYKVYKAGTTDYLRTNNEVTSSNSSNNGDYQESYTFDGNGNILSLSRNTYGGGSTVMDAFAYNYKTDVSGNILNNQLRHVDDNPSSSGVSTVDVDDQISDNYKYNALGQLVQDVQEDIDVIEWTVTGKVKRITFDNALNTAKTTTLDYVEFEYDPMGNRVSKKEVPLSGPYTQTYYVHDATGNVISVYEYKSTPAENFTLLENHIYGGKRLGIYDRGKDLLPAPSAEETMSRILGDRDYELTNHLGNVLEVISDRMLTIDGNSNGLTDYYTADVISYCDYTPYGVQMEGRQGSTTSYRYGFQGYEKDDEIKGEGNSYTTEFRQYDPRLGRWLSIDPITKSHESSYAAFANSPIWIADPNGADSVLTNATNNTWMWRAQENDTYSEISQATGVSIEDLRKWNGCEDGDITKGMFLYLSDPSTPPSDTRAAICTDYGTIEIVTWAPLQNESGAGVAFGVTFTPDDPDNPDGEFYWFQTFVTNDPLTSPSSGKPDRKLSKNLTYGNDQRAGQRKSAVMDGYNDRPGALFPDFNYLPWDPAPGQIGFVDRPNRKPVDSGDIYWNGTLVLYYYNYNTGTHTKVCSIQYGFTVIDGVLYASPVYISPETDKTNQKEIKHHDKTFNSSSDRPNRIRL